MPKIQFTAAERLMQEALAIINGARQDDYGPPDENYRRIGLLWTAYLQATGADCTVTPVMAVHMHDLAKLSRLIQTPNHEDTLRDRFGYNACNVALVNPEPADEPAFDASVGITTEQAIDLSTIVDISMGHNIDKAYYQARDTTCGWTMWPPNTDVEDETPWNTKAVG